MAPIPLCLCVPRGVGRCALKLKFTCLHWHGYLGVNNARVWPAFVLDGVEQPVEKSHASLTVKAMLGLQHICVYS